VDAARLRRRARSGSRSDLGRSIAACSSPRNSDAKVGTAVCVVEVVERPPRMRYFPVPQVEVTNRQRIIPISTHGLQRFAELASTLVCKHKRRRAEMESLRVISVLVVSD